MADENAEINLREDKMVVAESTAFGVKYGEYLYSRWNRWAKITDWSDDLPVGAVVKVIGLGWFRSVWLTLKLRVWAKRGN